MSSAWQPWHCHSGDVLRQTCLSAAEKLKCIWRRVHHCTVDWEASAAGLFEAGIHARMQAFVDKFRYNAKRASLVQSRIKAIERMADIQLVEADPEYIFRYVCVYRAGGGEHHAKVCIHVHSHTFTWKI